MPRPSRGSLRAEPGLPCQTQASWGEVFLGDPFRLRLPEAKAVSPLRRGSLRVGLCLPFLLGAS